MTLREAIQAVRDFLKRQQIDGDIIFYREFMPMEYTVCFLQLAPFLRLRTFHIIPTEPYCWQMKEVQG